MQYCADYNKDFLVKLYFQRQNHVKLSTQPGVKF